MFRSRRRQSVLPGFGLTLGFTLLYVLVPATRVPLKVALIGGLLAAAALEVAKHGFRFYIANFPTEDVSCRLVERSNCAAFWSSRAA